MIDAHKRELLSICLWKLSEVEGGKHGTRFQSEAAVGAPRRELAHEHVFERAKLVSALLASPNDIDAVVSKAVGCLVTRQEHKRLTHVSRTNPQAEGWERYALAGIKVLDPSLQEHATTPLGAISHESRTRK